ncbi:hypothetical protein BDW72DRAFT_209114 [Aspergillus terricola var. indicus]
MSDSNKNHSSDWVDRLKPASPDGATTITAGRNGSNIAIDELAQHLLGRDPLFSKQRQANLSRPDRYMLALARGKRLRQMADRHAWDDEDHEMAKYLVDDISPYQLHQTMFRQTLLEQASPEQRRYWMDLHQSWTIIGAYAQTELGHGSNVRGIELMARWDPETKEFILHSPTLTASKWWNGSLGRTATHSIKYKNYGHHLFITRVRNAETHKPLPGIVIGDIGPKYGYNTIDNAYMLFNNFCRYSRVDPETGKYYKPEDPAVVYGSMTHETHHHGRRLVLARAVTIAIRYCSIRRQFFDKENHSSEFETAVLDYPTVQIRLLPLLATTYALHYTGEHMGQIYEATSLIDLHSLSSGLKSLGSDLAANGIETCRRAMGGHGFGGGSGLVQLNADYLSKPTVEGDNWMITQRMARYLIKKVDLIVNASTGFTPSNNTERALLEFHAQAGTGADAKPCAIFRDARELVSAFERRAAYLLHGLSNAQSELVLVQSFFDGLAGETSLPASTRSILWHNFRLFALFAISKSSRDFLRSRAVLEEDLDGLAHAILHEMNEIRPHAVRLVDAWSIPDYLLDSALSRYDGRMTFNPDYRTDEIVKGSNDGGTILLEL